jgi:hypothetical protein
MLLGARPAFFHFPDFALQCWRARGSPAPFFFLCCNSPVSSVSRSLLQYFDQAKDSDGPVLML